MIRTATGFSQVRCSRQPCFFARTFVTKSQKSFHTLFLLPLRIQLNCLPLKSLWYLDRHKQPSLMFAALIPRNFLASSLNAGPI